MSIRNAVIHSFLEELEQGVKTHEEIVVLNKKRRKRFYVPIVTFAVMIVTCSFIKEVKIGKEMNKELDQGVENHCIIERLGERGGLIFYTFNMQTSINDACDVEAEFTKNILICRSLNNENELSRKYKSIKSKE